MFDANAITERLIRAGEDWADKFAAAEALEDAAETMLAKCFLEATGNVEERKARAKCDDQYDRSRKLSRDARHAANRAKVKYDVGKAYVELIRSQESTRRAEMTLR